MEKNNKMFSLIIPCYPPHIKYLPQLLDNIKKSLLQPNEIIVACSEIDHQSKIQIQQIIGTSQLKIILTITDQKQTPGENRNRGANLASCEYLIFQDADDLFHYQRLQIFKYIIDKYHPNLIFHNFFLGLNQVEDRLSFRIDVDKIQIIDTQQIIKLDKNNWDCKYKIPPSINVGYDVAHGPIAIKKIIFDKIKYTDDILGEDITLDRKILQYYGEVYYLNEKLMIYNH